MQDAEPSLDASAQGLQSDSLKVSDPGADLVQLSPEESSKPIKSALALLEARMDSLSQQPRPPAHDDAGLQRLESRLNALVRDRAISTPNELAAKPLADIGCQSSLETGLTQNAARRRLLIDQTPEDLHPLQANIATPRVSLEKTWRPDLAEDLNWMQATVARLSAGPAYLEPRESLDHDDFGRAQVGPARIEPVKMPNSGIPELGSSKIIMDTSDISAVSVNVIDSKKLERDMQISLRNLHEFDCAEKPAKWSTFSHPALAAIPSANPNLTTRIDVFSVLKQSGEIAGHLIDGSAIAAGLRTVPDEAEAPAPSVLNAVQEKLEKIAARLTQLDEKLGEIQFVNAVEQRPSGRHFSYFEQNRINRIGSAKSEPAINLLSSPQRIREIDLRDRALPAKSGLSANSVVQGDFPPISDAAPLLPDSAATSDVWQTSILPAEPMSINRDFVFEVYPAGEGQADDQELAYHRLLISETAAHDYDAVLIRGPRVSFLNPKLLLTLSAVALLSIGGAYAMVKAINQATVNRSPIMLRPVLHEAASRPIGGASDQADLSHSRSESVPNNLSSQATTGTDPSPISIAGREAEGSDSISSRATMITSVSKTTAEPTALRQQAEAGNAIAQFELGTRYAEGRLMERDFKLSADWYEKAAMRGLAPAQYRIGSLYETGVGVTRDLARARSWYEKAASQGHARAMYNLAALMSQGADDAPNYATAAIWFRKAAELGVRDSQYNLAILFARGLGVQRDFVQSYTWFAIAAAQGDEDAGKRREMVASMLKAKELAQAKAAAAAFRPRETDHNVNEVRNPLEEERQGVSAASPTFMLPAASMTMAAQSTAFPSSFSSIDVQSNGVNTYGDVSKNSVPESDVSTCSSLPVWKRFHQFGRVELTGKNTSCN